MNTAHRGWIAGLLLTAGLAGSGCQGRLFRASPYYSGKPVKNEKTGKIEVPEPDPERLNLWPLIYKSRGNFSLLWPLVEKTPDGFAFRPFVDVYENGQVIDILFPFARIDRKTGKSWVFPVFWDGSKERRYLHVFPLYWSWKSKDRWNWRVFPLAWGHASKKDRFGVVFPVAAWGRDWFFSPFALGRQDGDARWMAFPPALTFWSKDKDGHMLLTPVAGQIRKKDSTWNYILPLLTAWGRSQDSSSLYSPFVVRRRDRDGSWTALPPLLTFWRKDRDRQIFFSPVAGGVRTATSAWNYILPLLTVWGRSGETRTIASPLVISRSTLEGSSGVIPPLLFGWRRQGDRSTWASPLAFGSSTPEKAWSVTLPLALYYQRTGNIARWYSPFTLGKRGPKRSWINVMGILFHGRRNHENNTASGRILLGLGGYNRAPGRHRTWMLPFFGHSWDESLLTKVADGQVEDRNRSSVSVLLNLFRHTRSDRVLFDPSVPPPAELLDEGTGEVDYDKVYALRPGTDGYARWQAYLKRSQKVVRYRYHRLFPFYGYENIAGRRRKWHVLYALYRHREEWVWDEDEKRFLREVDSRFLWKAYHYHRRDDRVSVDVFPGITYDRIGKEEKHVSFLWRVFRYERKGARKKMHILFIPFRWGREKLAPDPKTEPAPSPPVAPLATASVAGAPPPHLH